MNSPPRYHLFLSVSSLSARFSVMSVAQVLARGPPAQLTGLELHPTPPEQGRKGSAPGAWSPAVPVNATSHQGGSLPGGAGVNFGHPGMAFVPSAP